MDTPERPERKATLSFSMHFLELQKLGLLETKSILIISAKIERAEDIKRDQQAQKKSKDFK